MGMALWLHAVDDAAAATQLLPNMPAAQRSCRYRIEVSGDGRAPWRASPAEAMQDAVRLDLASWDASRQQWFLAVPVDMRVEKLADE